MWYWYVPTLDTSSTGSRALGVGVEEHGGVSPRMWYLLTIYTFEEAKMVWFGAAGGVLLAEFES